ncbi:hypothetical protein M1L60_24310 [Actinoplanes sp. TRM 88003]|uniref:Uncharacterized protein n=1 Tax=Paractinoplanes aksuensis TaxID=2939490 RepID=A0ABT1DSB1_9ACTN|nr:hypothetical protein [Actinoplanes aksuensis]MCO8273724.1 hypothetical protein [Actinoplanes aksuensis]
MPALSRTESELFLAALGEPLNARRHELVLRFAQGNPLALGELFHAARTGATIEDSVVPITARLERAFASEVGALDPRARRLLLLAVAGVDISLAELMAAAATVGAGPGELGALEEHGLLTVSGGNLRFRHPLLRSTVYGRAALTERIAAHETLAAVVADPHRRAWHRAGAVLGWDDDIARELEEAARELARRGAPAEAAAALSRAAELTTGPRDRARRLVDAAEHARRAGLTDLVAELVGRARPLTDDPVVRLMLHTMRAGTAAFASATRPDLQPYADFARELAGRDAADFDENLLRLLWPMGPLVWLYGGDGPVVQQAVEHVLAIRTPRWSPWKWLLLAALDPPRFAERIVPRLDEMLALWESDPGALPVNFAHIVSAVQRVTRSVPLHEKIRDTLRAGGSGADQARHEVALATSRNVIGDPRGGLVAARVATRLSEALALPMQTAAGYAAEALAQAWLGDAAGSRAAFEASERTAPTAWPIVRANRHWAAGLLALSERRYREAWDHLGRTSVHATTYLWAIGDLTEAAVPAGETVAARAALADLHPDVLALDSPEVDATYERARALVD